MKRYLYALFIISFATATFAQSNKLDLSGEWTFRIDPNDVGIEEQWYNQSFPQSISLPGSLQEQGYGFAPSAETEWTSGIGMKLLKDPRFEEYINSKDFMCPFWLTPERHYTGPAWYRRDVTIPQDWQNQRIVLFLERPHWQTEVWVDGQKIGLRDSLGTPHEHDLTQVITPGEKHTIAIRVDNRYVVPVGMDAHSISDQTQSNWNGIAGDIALKATPKLWIDDIQVCPDIQNNRIKVSVAIKNISGKTGNGSLTLSATKKDIKQTPISSPLKEKIEWHANGATGEYTLELNEDWEEWNEYNPALCNLNLTLESEDEVIAARDTRFGMREIGIKEKQFTINGDTIFLRGTLECCIFPLHGYPPTEVGEWKRIIGIAKTYGLNHFRFHSWCPPEAAFHAADELGFFFQIEASCWASFGDGSELDRWIYQECDRMLKTYGNHPSFIMMSPSNEPGGRNRDAFLGKLMNYLIQKDSRHFYAAGSGWPQIPENQYHIQYQTRLQHWPTLKFDVPPQTWDDYREYVDKLDVPTVSHEIGQWCVYPDLSESRQYTGALKAKNIDIFHDKLIKAGMGHQARDFLIASGKFQTLLYKQEIETALRTPGFAGFQLLDLHDFPGQGTAPVGMLNALWQNKGYVTGVEFQRFCNDVVPLARMKKRIFTNDVRFEAAIDVANYKNNDLKNVQVIYRLKTESGQTVETGQFDNQTIPAGGLTRIGSIDQTLSGIDKACKVNLEVELKGYPYINDWNIWVYPAKVSTEPSPDIAIVQDWKQAVERLQQGQKVLLVPNPATVAGNTLGTFQPIFWNRITFPSQTVHTLGILCQQKHPALADFPTDFHSNWQWQDLLDKSKPIVMDNLPKKYLPIIQPIDDWNNCQKLGILFEAKAGEGKLLICSMDILDDLDNRPVARQLRHSLLKYMESELFDPQQRLTEEQIKSLFKELTLFQKLGAKATADSQESGTEADKAIDNDPRTIWHTRWTPLPDKLPHSFVIDMQKEIEITGLTYLPRQDMPNGRIAEYEIYSSNDGKEWTGPIATGIWPNDSKLKTVRFEKPVKTGFVKLIALSEVRGQVFTSAAEICVITEE